MNKNKFILYHNPMSRARVARWILEEAGANYELVQIDFKTKQQKAPEYLKINPMGKVPALVYNGHVITETAAICTYVADLFPHSKLAPEIQDPQRADYLRWMFFASGCVEPAMLDRAHPRASQAASSQLGYGSYEECFKVLKAQLTKGTYILGEKFSAADVYLSSVLSWGMRTKAIDPNPVFNAYVEKCMNRPAFARLT